VDEAAAAVVEQDQQLVGDRACDEVDVAVEVEVAGHQPGLVLLRGECSDLAAVGERTAAVVGEQVQAEGRRRGAPGRHHEVLDAVPVDIAQGHGPGAARARVAEGPVVDEGRGGGVELRDEDHGVVVRAGHQRPVRELVHHPVAVLVDAGGTELPGGQARDHVADHRELARRTDEGPSSLASAEADGARGAEQGERLVDPPVAVVVQQVAQLGVAGVDGRERVVAVVVRGPVRAVRAAARDPVLVDVEVLVHEPVAVVVQPVAELGRGELGRRRAAPRTDDQEHQHARESSHRILLGPWGIARGARGFDRAAPRAAARSEGLYAPVDKVDSGCVFVR